MLFYRRKSTKNQEITTNDNLERIPKWMIDEIRLSNESLSAKRAEYERSLNQTGVEVYLDSDFYLEKNVLNLHEHFENKHLKIYIDRQKTQVNELDEILIQRCTSPTENDELTRRESFLKSLVETHHFLLVNRVDTSNSGRFSYYVKSVLTDPKAVLHKLIAANKLLKDSVIVVCRYVDLWPIGDDFEPVRVVFKFYTKSFEIREVSCTFVKSTTIKSAKEEISTIILAENLNENSGILRIQPKFLYLFFYYIC